MFGEKQLDLLREGKIPISFNSDGMPTYAATAPIYELKQFIVALAHGYMRLYNRVLVMEKLRNNITMKKQREESQAS